MFPFCVVLFPRLNANIGESLELFEASNCINSRCSFSYHSSVGLKLRFKCCKKEKSIYSNFVFINILKYQIFIITYYEDAIHNVVTYHFEWNTQWTQKLFSKQMKQKSGDCEQDGDQSQWPSQRHPPFCWKCHWKVGKRQRYMFHSYAV